MVQVAITCREMQATQHLAIVRDAQLTLAMPHLWTVDAKGLELQVLWAGTNQTCTRGGITHQLSGKP